MGAVKERIFYHHADVSALGGYFESPVQGHVPIQASLSVAPSGGFGEVSIDEEYSFNQLVSFKSAKTRVSGTYSNGIWTTVANTEIRGFNILDVLNIDLMVSNLVSEHSETPGEYEPTVSAAGSYFSGVKVSGRELEVTLDHDFLKYFPDPAKASGPRTCLFKHDPFLGKVQKQYERTIDEFNAVAKLDITQLSDGTQARPAWVEARYSVNDLRLKKDQRGMVVCSLVKSIQDKDTERGKGPRCYYGNVLDIENFGRVFLGELLVDHNTHRLIMARAELGSPASGGAAAGTTSLEGRPWP